MHAAALITALSSGEDYPLIPISELTPLRPLPPLPSLSPFSPFPSSRTHAPPGPSLSLYPLPSSSLLFLVFACFKTNNIVILTFILQQQRCSHTHFFAPNLDSFSTEAQQDLCHLLNSCHIQEIEAQRSRLTADLMLVWTLIPIRVSIDKRGAAIPTKPV